MFGRKGQCLQDFEGNTWKERDCLRSVSIDDRIVSKWILRKWGGDWIHLAQGRETWQAAVNTVMNLKVP